MSYRRRSQLADTVTKDQQEDQEKKRPADVKDGDIEDGWKGRFFGEQTRRNSPTAASLNVGLSGARLGEQSGKLVGEENKILPLLPRLL